MHEKNGKLQIARQWLENTAQYPTTILQTRSQETISFNDSLRIYWQGLGERKKNYSDGNI